MPTARTDDGVSIAYEARGAGPPDVLFMHGWAGSGAYFEETLSHLDLTRLRAITFDLRGHGDSDKPDGGYTLDGFAADALAVADAAGAREFVLVGFSMSGKFGQYVACMRPDRVLGQILVGGAPAAELPLPPELVTAWLGLAGSAEGFIELARTFITQPVDDEVIERFAADAARVPVAALAGTMTAITSASFAERLDGLDVPTLVVGGIHDSMFTPDALRGGVVGPLPRARLALLDSNHEMPVEQPRELAALIEAFLAGLGVVVSAAQLAPGGRS